MAKFKLNSLPERERIKLIAEFYDAMSLMRNRNEVRFFLKDLLHPDEIAMLARRIQAAILLLTGFTYDEVLQILKVGNSTVASVYRKIERGGDGFELITRRLLKLKRKRELEMIRNQKQMTPSIGLKGLKKKYPLHFLLFNLADALKDYIEKTGEAKEIDRKVSKKNIFK